MKIVSIIITPPRQEPTGSMATALTRSAPARVRQRMAQSTMPSAGRAPFSTAIFDIRRDPACPISAARLHPRHLRHDHETQATPPALRNCGRRLRFTVWTSRIDDSAGNQCSSSPRGTAARPASPPGTPAPETTPTVTSGRRCGHTATSRFPTGSGRSSPAFSSASGTEERRGQRRQQQRIRQTRLADFRLVTGRWLTSERPGCVAQQPTEPQQIAPPSRLIQMQCSAQAGHRFLRRRLEQKHRLCDVAGQQRGGTSNTLQDG